MSAVEQALSGRLGRVPARFPLRSENGPVFTSRVYTRHVRRCGLPQKFIAPHCSSQSAMIERVIPTLTEQCLHRPRYETQQHASRVIGE
jgi:putative transposase